MYTKRVVLVGLVALLAPEMLWGQQHRVTGTVADSAGRPLGGVLVRFRGATRAAETDTTGRFSIGSLPTDTILLSFERVGYRVGTVRMVIRETDEPELPLGLVRLRAAALKLVTVRLNARERLTGRPIDGAMLELNGKARMYTGGSGNSIQPGTPVFAGLNTAVVRRIGYQGVTFDLWVPETETEVSLDVSLEPAPVTLPPVTVTGDAVHVRYSWADAFYQRARSGFGDILTEARIKQLGSYNAVSLLSWLPKHSVSVTEDPYYGTPRYRIKLTGTPPNCEARGLAPVFYLNGLRTGDSSAIDQLQMVDPQDVLGIEVYGHPAEIPPEFNTTGADCGVIVFWIRR